MTLKVERLGQFSVCSYNLTEGKQIENANLSAEGRVSIQSPVSSIPKGRTPVHSIFVTFYEPVELLN